MTMYKMSKHTNLSLAAFEGTDERSGYKYLISTTFANGYVAFRKEQGLREFIEMSNTTLRYIDSREGNKIQGKIRFYQVMGEVEEISFTEASDIPEGATTFKGLSNGSLVDCYYLRTENGSQIYRPNPNYKDIYKPMELQEHIAYQRIHG